MKNKQFTLLVVLTIIFVTTIHSQSRIYDIKNGFAIGGGITQFNIKTDNFITTKSNGFAGGMSATVDLPHRWYTVSYGMQLSENTIEISGRMTDDVTGNERIEYKLMAAQLGFLFHGKILGNYLSIDAGPQLQYNGKLEFKNSLQETYYINGYDNLTAEDITDVSQFNVNGAVGVTTGIGAFKVRAQYIYGFLNMFEKLNTKDLDVGNTNFNGNPETIAFSAMITF